MTTTEHPPVYSTLGGDPDLGELVDMFVAEMPDRIATVEQALCSGDLEALQQVAHQMKGAAGSYGFQQITAFAATVEYSVRDGAPEETLRKVVLDLVNLCRQVRSGTP